MQSAVHLAAPAAVVGVQDPLVPDGLGDPREVRDGVGVPEPGGRVEVETVLDRSRPFGEWGGERGLELQLGGGQLGAETEFPRGAWGAGEEEGAGLDVGQAGETGAVAVRQPVPAGRAAVGEDGDSGGAEGFDVAVDGTDGHLELGGEFGRGHPAAVLQEQEQGEKPVGAHGTDCRPT